MLRSIITPGKVVFFGVVLIGLLFTCALVTFLENDVWIRPDMEDSQIEVSVAQDQLAIISTATPTIAKPILTPTPDVPHQLPPIRTDSEQYVVQPRDSLHQIALEYFVSVDAILGANEISQPDYLEVGQVLTIPAPQPERDGLGFKIIPDSELVYGPASTDFLLAEFVHSQRWTSAR